jgi:hypothetical protein
VLDLPSFAVLGFAISQTLCQDHVMRVVTAGGSLGYRLATVVLIIAGLIGMHHMVSVACSAVLNPHGPSHELEFTNIELIPALPTISRADTYFHPSEIDSPALDRHVGLDCLAILLVIAVAIPILRELMNRRKPLGHAHENVQSRYFQATHPPDLKRLPISRT